MLALDEKRKKPRQGPAQAGADRLVFGGEESRLQGFLRRGGIPHIVLLVAVSFLVFGNTLKNPFMWDDAGLVGLIASDKYQKHLKNPFFFLTKAYWRDYRNLHDVDVYVPVSPLRTFSLNLDHKLWGGNPFGYHLTNILLHAVNVLLVYLLCLAMFKDPRLALFTGMLFAVHPMHTEAVSWVKNRVDLIAAAFYLSALTLFIEASPGGGALLARRFRPGLLLAGAAGCFTLAILSKEIVVTLPAVMVLYILCFVAPEERKKSLLLTAPFWLLTLGAFYLEFVIAKPGISQPHSLDVYTNILVVFKTVAYYAVLVSLPFQFCADRVLALPDLISEPVMMASVALTGGLVYAGFGAFPRHKTASFCAFWFLIVLSPVANIFYLAPRPIGEHRLYLPSLAFCLILGKVFADGAEYLRRRAPGRDWGRLPLSALGAILLVFAVLTVRRNADWSNEIRFWSQTVKQSPRSPRAWTLLGEAHCKVKDYARAKEAFESALQVGPAYPPAHSGLGLVYFRTGDPMKAVQYFKRGGNIE
ncbi:MAG: tetratricopeptide repeat protein [Elusimicrobiota bacterium]